MTLEEWPTVLAPFLQEKLASYPALAAILWAAAVLCNGGVPLGEQRLQMERHAQFLPGLLPLPRKPLTSGHKVGGVLNPASGSFSGSFFASPYVARSCSSTWAKGMVARIDGGIPSFLSIG